MLILEMARVRVRLTIGSYLMFMLLACAMHQGFQDQAATAATGEIFVAPGETRYVEFGSAPAGAALLYSVTITTQSTTLSYWLEAPDGRHIAVEQLKDGSWADQQGYWSMGFSIDVGDAHGAEVAYDVRVVNPQLTVETPSQDSWFNWREIAVSGTIEGAGGLPCRIDVSVEGAATSEATILETYWWATVTCPADGAYNVSVEAAVEWNNFTAVRMDMITVSVDTVPPSVEIISPADGETIRGDTVTVEWRFTDETGYGGTFVASEGDWSDLLEPDDGFRETLTLGHGDHRISVTAWDLAGNTVVDSVDFRVNSQALSFQGPYYGLPVIGMGLAVVVFALLIVKMVMRRGPRLEVPSSEAATPAHSPTPERAVDRESPPIGVCANCHTVNPDHAHYCMSCGFPLGMARGGMTAGQGFYADRFGVVQQPHGHHTYPAPGGPHSYAQRPGGLTAAGLFMLICGFLVLIGGVLMVLMGDFIGGFNAGLGASVVCWGALLIGFGLPAIFGGFSALAGQRFLLVLVASVLGLVGMVIAWGILGAIPGMIAVICVAISKDDFRS